MTQIILTADYAAVRLQVEVHERRVNNGVVHDKSGVAVAAPVTASVGN